jgi:hypothetical protein
MTVSSRPSFQRRIARQRLAIEADEIVGGHLVALSHPRELAERIEAYGSRGRSDLSGR